MLQDTRALRSLWLINDIRDGIFFASEKGRDLQVFFLALLMEVPGLERFDARTKIGIQVVGFGHWQPDRDFLGARDESALRVAGTLVNLYSREATRSSYSVMPCFSYCSSSDIWKVNHDPPCSLSKPSVHPALSSEFVRCIRMKGGSKQP